MKKINSYKNGVLHEWMTTRISFALTLPLCRDNDEKRQTLADHEEIMLDNIFAIYGRDAEEYAKRLLAEHPLYQAWKELEKSSSDMKKESIYLPREVYKAARAEIMMLDRAGLAEVYASQCDEVVFLSVYACAQVRRKIDRIINNNRKGYTEV